MTDLITRLENARAGDRELDALVWAHIMRGEADGDEEIEADGGAVSVYLNMRRIAKKAAPKLTTSIDAITALIEEKLPDASLGSRNIKNAYDKTIYYAAAISANYKSPLIEVEAETEPLARCIAFLKALEARDG